MLAASSAETALSASILLLGLEPDLPVIFALVLICRLVSKGGTLLVASRTVQFETEPKSPKSIHAPIHIHLRIDARINVHVAINVHMPSQGSASVDRGSERWGYFVSELHHWWQCPYVTIIVWGGAGVHW